MDAAHGPDGGNRPPRESSGHDAEPDDVASLRARLRRRLDALSSSLTSPPGEGSAGESRYVVEEEIARGGMGAVLRVWDGGLRRRSAMKICLEETDPDRLGDREVRSLDRFLTEAEITGQLDHPGIVPVHEMGVDADGRPFFTMRLVEGKSLLEIIEPDSGGERQWSVARTVREVLLKVCEAVAYAHSKGVVHRDLKPSNVMVGPFGEAYVMDWGLAARIDADGSEAEEIAGPIAGTPAYMCPEQARGEPPDVRADVYSAGAILYHLLAGEMPYGREKSSHGSGLLFDRLINDSPTPLLQIDPTLPLELVAVCEKAMAREPGRRYATMAEMTDDLRAWLDGRVVHAYESGAVAELRKWVARNPLPVALALVVVGGLAGIVAILSDRNDALAAEVDRTNAEKYVANLHAADASLRVLETAEAKRRLADCPEDLREWEWRHLARRADSSEVVLVGHGDAVTALAFGPRGRRLASASRDQTVRLWDVRRRELERVLEPRGGAVLALAIDPGAGTWVAAGLESGTLALFDAATGELLHAVKVGDGPVVAVGSDAEGHRVAAGLRGGLVRIWDTGDMRERIAFRATRGGTGPADFLELVDLAVSPDGQRLLAGSSLGDAHEWDVATGELLHSYDDIPVTAIESIVYRPDGRGFAVASPDRNVRELDLETGELRASYAGHERGVKDAVFSHGGQRLVTASNDNTLRVWSTRTEETEFVHLGHDGDVTCVAASPDGAWLASGSKDRTVRLWSVRPGAASVLGSDLGWIEALAVHPRVPLVAAVGRGIDTPIHRWIVWDSQTRAVQAQSTVGGRLDCVAFDPVRPHLWAGVEKRGLVCWSTETGARHSAIAAEGATWTAIAFTPDGELLLAGSTEGELVLWDVERETPRRRWAAHDARIASIDCAPDGETVATASWDKSVRVWDLATGALRQVLDGHSGRVGAVAFEPDGRRLLSASTDRTLRVWDAATGTELARLIGHEGRVADAAWDPTGRRIVSGSSDETVRVWHAGSGEALLTLRGHGEPVTAVAFAPGGGAVLSGSEDETLRVWEGR